MMLGDIAGRGACLGLIGQAGQSREMQQQDGIFCCDTTGRRLADASWPGKSMTRRRWTSGGKHCVLESWGQLTGRLHNVVCSTHGWLACMQEGGAMMSVVS